LAVLNQTVGGNADAGQSGAPRPGGASRTNMGARE
jgi:hypothetical protein